MISPIFKKEVQKNFEVIYSLIVLFSVILKRRFLGFSGGSDSKESVCNAGDLGSIPGLGRCPGEGKGHPLQYSGLENSMDCIVHGITKNQTQLSDFTSLHLSFIGFPGDASGKGPACQET